MLMCTPDMQKLVGDIKNYLDITYNDAATDLKLQGIVNRGMSYLDNIAGAVQEYTEEGYARQLLFDYCRYARSNNLEEFSRNFNSDLVMLRIMNGVEDYAATHI